MIELDICECENVDSFGATVFQSLTNLTFLSLKGTKIKNINGIQVLINLTSLNLGYCEYLTDLSLFLISSLTELKTLILERVSRITSAGLESFTTLKNLTDINLNSCCRILHGDNNALRHLKKMTNLKSLDISECELSGDCLYYLPFSIEKLNN